MASTTATFNDGIIPEPGIHRNNSPYYSGVRWVDGDKVRFSSNVPEKIGGWGEEIVDGTLYGIPRRNLSWSSISAASYSAIGTHLFLYVRSGGTYFNITPFRASSSLVNPLTTVSGSNSVNILDTAHGAREGDWINIPTSVTYNGVTLLGDYEVDTVGDVDNFTIIASTNASGNGTGGGAIDVNYYLEAGLADSGASGFGWGVGDYGEEEWGDARSVGLFGEARMWCLENWGEDLLALPLGGKLYFWDTSVGVGTRAAEVTGAPDRSNFMIVSSKFRQVILFGTEDVSAVFDPMLIRWSDSEDYTDFTPSVGSLAGEYRLTIGSKIIGALETKNGEILVWTDSALYRMTPVATSAVFRVELVGKACGLLSPFAAADVDGTVIWMSNSSCKMYTGQVRNLPLSVEDYIFDPNSTGKFNDDQTIKFHAGINGDFNELWFFYATTGSAEIDRYFIYNYGNNTSYDGSLQRTTWTDKALDARPIAYDSTGHLYVHEQGRNNNGSAMLSYVKTGQIDVSNGDDFLFVDKYIPDGILEGTMSVTLYARKYVNSSQVSTKTYTIPQGTEKVDVRSRGRLLEVKIESNTANGYYKLGKIKFASRTAGKR